MALEYKTKESFYSELVDYMNVNQSTIIEAMVAYQDKYDLDEQYIVNNLMSPGLYEKLKTFAKEYNLIKKEDEDSYLHGI
jgi:proline dehydrogenase